MLWTPISEYTGAIQTGNDLTLSAGTLITPGANDAKGSWTALLGSSISANCYAISIHIHSNTVDLNARPTLVDIGIDYAGGTSYSVLIPNLNASCASTLGTWGGAVTHNEGYWYFFPLFIPSGATLAARAQVGNASAGSLRVEIRLLTNATLPERCPFGTKVEAIGVDTVNSRGTVIALGTNPTYGAWTSLGTTSIKGFWIQASISVDDTGMDTAFGLFEVAVGDSTNKRIILSDVPYETTSTERMSVAAREGPECFVNLPVGSQLWARCLETTGSVNSNQSVIVWVVGA